MAVNPLTMVMNALRGKRGSAATAPNAIASMVQTLTDSSAPLVAMQNELQTTPPNPQQATILQIIGMNNAQVHVTPDLAMMVSAVWACIDVISSALASSNWNVYAGMRDDGNEYLLPGDATHYILNTRWNPEMTAKSAKHAVMICAVGMGNGYAEIVRDMAGRVSQLWPIRTDRVEVMRGERGLFYRVHNDWGGGWVDLSPSDILHIKGPGVDGLLGNNPMAQAVQTIAKAIALDQFTAAYFANGTQLGGVLEYTGKVDDATYNRLKEQFNGKYRGASKAFNAAILEGGMKWTQVNTDAERAQLIEAGYASIEEIARWFHCPPHKIGHLLRATNNNIEHQGLEFVRDTLRPWKIESEQECDFKLFPVRGQRRFICIDLDWATDGDFKSRMEAFQIARGMGVYSANDILVKLGENKIGPEGDLRIVNGAAIPLKDVGKNYNVQQAPAAKPTDPAETDPEDGDDDVPAGDGDTSTVEAWTRSAFNRIARRRANRLADLKKAGRPDAETEATDDAKNSAAGHLEGLVEIVAMRWPDGGAAHLRVHAAMVAAGGDAAQLAEQFIRKMRGQP